jgi:hypothetical protein
MRTIGNSLLIQLQNYMLYKGAVSLGTETYENGKKPTCFACKMRENKLDTLHISVKLSQTVQQILD